ncbi:MAG TPA: hypothetical protein PLZ95_18410 [Bryobacteraceae bacterium]|nr:hypothetical protein [Bryobacteraceae bacterium]
MASFSQSIQPDPVRAPAAPPQALLEIRLSVTDPEVISELEKSTSGPERERFALSALRLGVLALRQARGDLDAGVVREAGQRILHDLESLLNYEGSRLTGNLAGALKQYFDKDSGELPRRLESLLKQDGEFERFLRQHLGPEASTLAKTLDQHLQPILRLLDPEEAQGVQARIRHLLDSAVEEQRNQVLREFSLDSEDSALSRLMRKVTDKNGEFTKDVRALVDELAGEFSLDKEDSALSRLVKKVEDAQGLIGRSLTLDDENSPLSRLKRELQSTIDGLTKSNADFQQKVLEALARLQTQRDTAAKSTLHGLTFEDRLGELLAMEATRLNDVHECTGSTAGAITYCKIGDFVTTMGPESAAPGVRIVWEAKSNKSYQLADALKELDQARKNRQAQIGVFVYSKDAAPSGTDHFARYGSNLIVVWDPEDTSTDLHVKSAYSVARALVIRESHESSQSEAAVQAIELATRGVEKQLKNLGEIKTWANTVKSSGEKIAESAGKIQDALQKQVEELDQQIAALKTSQAEASV